MLSINNRYDFIIEDYENEKLSVLDGLHHFFDNSNLETLWNITRDIRDNRNHTAQLPTIDFLRGFMTHEKVLKQLDIKYWTKLMTELNVYAYMPSKEREKWQDQIREGNVPVFNMESIKPTISDVMRDLPRLFADRLKGAHDTLSRAHKTNKAQQFDKRLIFQVMYPDKYSWGGGNYSRVTVGAINDIRSTISQLLGGEQLNEWDTEKMLTSISKNGHFGEWVKIDPYIAVRIYKKGTCHLEIHPRLLDQLNNILSDGSLPDMSSDWYQKEEKKKRTEFHDLVHLTVSPDLLEAIRRNQPNSHDFWDYIEHGTYDDKPVRDYVLNTGLLPEFKSHQFYPTPQNIVDEFQKYIPESGSILEPSAGTGRLINGINQDRVTCIDIAGLHCEILKAKGFKNTYCMDFMKYSTDNKFDCIVMNPPYSKQRALLHIEKAKKHLNPNGFILAVIPTGKITNDMQTIQSFTGGFDKNNINTSIVRINNV